MQHGNECHIRVRSPVTFVIGLLLALLFAGAASAADLQREINFNIPRQPLAQALADFSRQSNLIVVAPSELTNGKMSTPVVRTATALQALRLLLQDSGLEYTQDRDGSIVVRKSATPPTDGSALAEHPTPGRNPTSSGVQTPDSDTGGDSGSHAQLEEIVVTSQRRSEGLQSVPIAVTALSAASLANRNIVNVQDFNAIAPNVSFGEFNGVARINIRGVGNQNYFIGGDPSVAMYLDGAVIAQAWDQMSSFFDLDRVEVLRGPQGTLYGRNATGGSVNLISRKPTAEFEGYANAGIANYDEFQFEGALSGPLANSLNGRVAAFRQSHSGYGINESDGRDIDDANRLYTRAQLAYGAGAQHFLLSFNYGRERDTNYGIHVFGTANPGTLTTGQLLGGHLPARIRDVNSEAPLRNHRDSYSVTGDYTNQLTDRLSLRSIANYRRYKQDYITDSDGTEKAYSAILVGLDSKQASEELQATYEGERLKLVSGLYYFHSTVFGANQLGTPYTFTVPVPVRGPPGRFGIGLIGTVTDAALGAFAQANYALTGRLGLTLGVRYSDESRDGKGTSYGPTNLIPPVATPAHIHDSNVSDKAGLEWHFDSSNLAYASYSTGFKSGVILVGSTNPPAKPETVTAYEVGLKSEFLERRLRTNLAVFYMDYKDLQLAQLLQGGTVPVITNAATAMSRGVEAEIAARPGQRWLLEIRAGYLDATFRDFESRDPSIAPPAVAPLVNLRGKELPYAPRWSGSVHVEYHLPTGALEDRFQLTASSDITSTARTEFSPFNQDDLAQPGYTKADASLRLDKVDHSWWVSAWVKNLTNQLTYANRTVSGGITTNYAIYGALSPPRTYGLTAGVNF